MKRKKKQGNLHICYNVTDDEYTDTYKRKTSSQYMTEETVNPLEEETSSKKNTLYQQKTASYNPKRLKKFSTLQEKENEDQQTAQLDRRSSFMGEKSGLDIFFNKKHPLQPAQQLSFERSKSKLDDMFFSQNTPKPAPSTPRKQIKSPYIGPFVTQPILDEISNSISILDKNGASKTLQNNSIAFSLILSLSTKMTQSARVRSCKTLELKHLTSGSSKYNASYEDHFTLISLSYVMSLNTYKLNHNPSVKKYPYLPAKTLNKSFSLDDLDTIYIDTKKSIIQFVVSNQMNVESCMTLTNFRVGGKTVMVHGISSYKNISQKCTHVISDLGITDSVFARAMLDIFNGKTAENSDAILSLRHNKSAIKFCSHLVNLLFVAEASRDSSALITNHMFIDLVISKHMQFKDMYKILPMALVKAVSALRGLSDLTYIETIHGFTRYDFSKQSPQKVNLDLIEEFFSRTNNLFKSWIQNIHKTEITDELSSNIFQNLEKYTTIIIQKGMKLWYEIEIEPFFITENIIFNKSDEDDYRPLDNPDLLGASTTHHVE